MAPSIRGKIALMQPRGTYERVRSEVEATDPEVVAAIEEVDLALLKWALSLSPWERLRAASGTLAFLSGFRRVATGAR